MSDDVSAHKLPNNLRSGSVMNATGFQEIVPELALNPDSEPDILPSHAVV
jgi:hypothetical protein